MTNKACSASRLRGGALVTMVAVSAASALAQSPAASSPSLESYRRARALVDAAIAAHGGEERLRAIEDVSFKARGRRWMPYQSVTLDRPWNVQRTQNDLVLDFKNARF